MTTTDEFRACFIQAAESRLAQCLEKIGHCVDQLDDSQIWWRPHEQQNSIANILLHLAGNMRQWIIAGVGGAVDDRDRPQEFASREAQSKQELVNRLEQTAEEVRGVMAQVTSQQLVDARKVQGFDETGLSAIFESLAHLTGHQQEIVYITRLMLGDDYRFHWEPPEKN